MTDAISPPRRDALRAAVVGTTTLLLVGTGCDNTRTPEESTPMTDDTPTAEEALAALGEAIRGDDEGPAEAEDRTAAEDEVVDVS